MSEEWIKTWCWGHKCVDKIYGVPHGDCVYLHKDVLICTTCDTSQLKLFFDELGIRDLDE